MVKSVSKQRSQRAGLEARDWLPTEVTIPAYKQETEAQSTRQESFTEKKHKQVLPVRLRGDI